MTYQEKRIKFKKPPVIEVAAVVRFDSLEPKKLALNLDQLWTHLGKEEYPTFEFKNDLVAQPGPRLSLEEVSQQTPFRFPQYWLEGRDRTDLIQLSHYKIGFNWRRLSLDDNNIYKAYEHVWDKFSAAVRAFEKFSNAHMGVALQPRSLELAYFNVVKLNDFGGSFSKIGNLYPTQKWLDAPWLKEPSVFNFSWIVPDADTQRNMSIQSVTGVDFSSGEPLLRLDIVVQGDIPEESYTITSEDFKKWFDESHTSIVKTFSSLTSDDVQKTAWEKVDE